MVKDEEEKFIDWFPVCKLTYYALEKEVNDVIKKEEKNVDRLNKLWELREAFDIFCEGDEEIEAEPITRFKDMFT